MSIIEFEVCGCRSTRGRSRHKAKSDKNERAGYYCKKHGNFWAFKITKCQDCGIELKTWSGPGKAKKCCPECLRIRSCEKQRRYNIIRLKKRVTPKIRVKVNDPFKDPVRARTIGEALFKKVLCVPSEVVFRLHNRISQ